MKTNWTPGPWQVLPAEVDKMYLRVRGTRPGGRYKVCNVETPYYIGASEREAGETHANAQLIAAAPELYDALDDLVNGDWPSPELWVKARAVLAKARGE